jgi:hypothetical protein
LRDPRSPYCSSYLAQRSKDDQKTEIEEGVGARQREVATTLGPPSALLEATNSLAGFEVTNTFASSYTRELNLISAHWGFGTNDLSGVAELMTVFVALTTLPRPFLLLGTSAPPTPFAPLKVFDQICQPS